MGEEQKNEMGHILDMVSSGKITPEDGEKLLNALEKSKNNVICPYCAEKIDGSSAVCPECKSNLRENNISVSLGNGKRGRSFHSVGGLSKVLIIYMGVVSIIVLLGSFGFFSPKSLIPMVMAVLGLIAAVMMWKGNNVGWILGIIWSGLQILEIIVQRFPLNRQFFQVGINTLTNGDGVGINIVGIVLLILFLVVRKEWFEEKENNYMR
jgi:hypothetical protein